MLSTRVFRMWIDFTVDTLRLFGHNRHALIRERFRESIRIPLDCKDLLNGPPSPERRRMASRLLLTWLLSFSLAAPLPDFRPCA